MNVRNWNCVLAGRLVDDEENLPNPRWSPAFINNHGSVQFLVKVMSDTPDNLSNVEYYSCWDNKLPGFYDDVMNDEEERIAELKRFLEDKIILFKPFQRIDSFNRNERYHSSDPITILEMPPGMGPDSRLIPMLHIPDMTMEEFETKLFSGQPIATHTRTFPKEMPITDPIIVWVRDRIYGPFSSMRSARSGWILGGDAVQKMPVNLNEYETLILPYRNVVYVDSDTYFQNLIPTLENEGTTLVNEMPSAQEVAAVQEIAPVQEAAPVSDPVEPVAAGDEPSPTTPVVTSPTSNGTTPVGGNATSTTEVGFFDRLTSLIQARRLFYDEQDLLNFHTALKTGNLVLLSGMSGTGKSQLVQVYASALGLGDDQFRIITVHPTWTDGSDLLGFLDLTHNIYRPSDTGLVDLLVKAEQNPDKLFLVCFDEMNLARVEHYFSQFISVLELDSNRRYIQLYNNAVEDRIYNAAQYPARLFIGSNILFVGTINIDESTYAFSDKVLDRAHVIRPRVLPFTNLRHLFDQTTHEIPTPEILFDVYNDWRNLTEEIELTDDELNFLEQVHAKLQNIDLQRGIGYRSLRQIDAYLKNIPVNASNEAMLDRSAAFDLQIVQKVLTKLRGPQEQLEGLVGQLDDEDQLHNSQLITLMDASENISSFKESRLEIHHKAKELRNYGYAS